MSGQAVLTLVMNRPLKLNVSTTMPHQTFPLLAPFRLGRAKKPASQASSRHCKTRRGPNISLALVSQNHFQAKEGYAT